MNWSSSSWTNGLFPSKCSKGTSVQNSMQYWSNSHSLLNSLIRMLSYSGSSLGYYFIVRFLYCQLLKACLCGKNQLQCLIWLFKWQRNWKGYEQLCSFSSRVHSSLCLAAKTTWWNCGWSRPGSFYFRISFRYQSRSPYSRIWIESFTLSQSNPLSSFGFS